MSSVLFWITELKSQERAEFLVFFWQDHSFVPRGAHKSVSFFILKVHWFPAPPYLKPFHIGLAVCSDTAYALIFMWFLDSMFWCVHSAQNDRLDETIRGDLGWFISYPTRDAPISPAMYPASLPHTRLSTVRFSTEFYTTVGISFVSHFWFGLFLCICGFKKAFVSQLVLFLRLIQF